MIPFVLATVLVFFVLLFGAVALTCIGISGLSVSLFLKNEAVKSLMLIGFGIVLSVGLMCLCPFVVPIIGLPTMIVPLAMCLFGAGAPALSVLGIKRAKDVSNRIVRTILTILFYTVLIIILAAVLSIVMATALMLISTLRSQGHS
jgi:hypothetical protein